MEFEPRNPKTISKRLEENKLKNSSREGMLSDNDIRYFWKNGIDIFTSERGELAFDLDKQLQLGSIDLRFRHECRKTRLKETETLTIEHLKRHDYTESVPLIDSTKLVLKPGDVIFTTTLETVQLSKEFAGIITGRSSIARLGVMVHCCQEYLNPGHGQPVPLQIVNLGPSNVELDLTVPICQLILFKLRTPASKEYVNQDFAKYANETDVQTSQLYKDFENESYISDKKEYKYNIKKFINRWSSIIEVFIGLSIITPLYQTNLEGKTVFDISQGIGSLQVSIILGIVMLILYIWAKKGN